VTEPAPAPGPRRDDPVRIQRARAARIASLGQRLGAGLFALAFVLVVAGLVTTFAGWVATGAIVALVVGSLLLAPAIVLSFAVRAAEREDRERGL
jgi:uncharacterized RDD family membrane protein YckC